MDLLDTDILIDVQRGHQPALAWFNQLQELPCVPGYVVMELIQDARNNQEVDQALKLVAPFQIVWPTASDCTQALAEFSKFHLSHGMGLIDALIGACALGLTARLCTFNEKHYRQVPGLVTYQPYSR
jgi:predicted nucleic acid-binding protein